jgi:hypothetical protein
MNVHETIRSEAVEQASDPLGRGSSEAADIPSSSSAGEQVRRGPSSPGSPSLISPSGRGPAQPNTRALGGRPIPILAFGFSSVFGRGTEPTH